MDNDINNYKSLVDYINALYKKKVSAYQNVFILKSIFVKHQLLWSTIL